jgi:16S rRNA (guanine966-N2)-methyltransferase
VGEQRVRIISGEWRGRRIAAPDGRDTRPTSDRVREAVFDILCSRLGPDLGEPVVLDLFAGSGALGLEALSRGAREAVFVERDRRALDILRSNVESLGAHDYARIVPADALRPSLAPGLPGGPFSLLFADPPYRIEPAQTGEVFAAIAAAGRCAPGAWIVYEHDARTTAQWPATMTELDRRAWGSTAVSFATMSEGEPVT